MSRWGFHACIFDRDCRRWDAPNRWHLFTPWGQLIVGIGRDNFVHTRLPWLGERWSPVAWVPRRK